MQERQEKSKVVQLPQHPPGLDNSAIAIGQAPNGATNIAGMSNIQNAFFKRTNNEMHTKQLGFHQMNQEAGAAVHQ
jgi:hypothetical protein